LAVPPIAVRALPPHAQQPSDSLTSTLMPAKSSAATASTSAWPAAAVQSLSSFCRLGLPLAST
jgi:hypothetical protein